tara:strand:- start:25463 stop:25567 length:105 start_codon:yes stop_codon:yes gene_type:complete
MLKIKLFKDLKYIPTVIPAAAIIWIIYDPVPGSR